MSSSHRLPFLRALQAILTYAHPLHDSLLTTRLTKALLLPLSAVIATQSESKRSDDAAVKGKKGKKRIRGYEGDELFKVSREVIYPTIEDGRVVLVALDVIHLVIYSPYLGPVIHSISSRVLLSMLLALPQISPASLSPHLALHGQLLGKVQTLCTELGAGTTSGMSKSLGLVIGSVNRDGSEHAQRMFDLLLHPRMPPLVRSLPHVESLSLFCAEESQEEIAARESLALGAVNQDTPSKFAAEMQDINLEESQPSPPPPPKQHTPAARFDNEPITPACQELIPATSTIKSSLVAHTLTAPRLSASLPPPTLVPLDKDDDDDDDEMPVINMDSDSD